MGHCQRRQKKVLHSRGPGSWREGREGGAFLGHMGGSKCQNLGVVAGVLVAVELEEFKSLLLPIRVCLANELIPSHLVPGQVLPVGPRDVDRSRCLKHAATGASSRAFR
jgi:hypothetical protein